MLTPGVETGDHRVRDHPAEILAWRSAKRNRPVGCIARIDDGRKIWKLSPMDLKSFSRWYDYSRARDEMFQATDTPWAPWYVVRSDDKKRARLNAITTCSSIFLTRKCSGRR